MITLSSPTQLLLSFLLLAVSFVATQPIGVVGVPFNQTAPQFDSYGCYLNASALNITSIEPNDLITFYRQLQSTCSEITVDLSFNQLVQLPINLFENKTAHQFMNLSHNLFTGETIANFFSNDSTASTVFFSPTGVEFINKSGVALDLSYNRIGPLPPTIFQFMNVDQLICQYCGLTSLPSGSFKGAQINNLDLSYNDFSAPGSIAPLVFDGLAVSSIILNNCNLRTSSLPAYGLFHTTAQLTSDLSFSIANNPHSFDNLTSISYLATWPNIFVDLTSTIFSAPDQALGLTLFQLQVSSLTLGDFISFQGDTSLFINSTWTEDLLDMSFNLAPSVAMEAIGDVTNWCPVQQLARALSYCWWASHRFTISAFGLVVSETAASATECTFPRTDVLNNCSHDRPDSTFFVSTEPVLLQREFLTWIHAFAAPFENITWMPPFGSNWNPHLNRSDWMPQDMLCDLTRMTTLVLPGLPYPQFQFPPPDKMLACLTTPNDIYDIVLNIDWSQSRLFSSGMFDGRPDDAPNINVAIDLHRLLSRDRPVPLDFFTPLINHLEHGVLNFNWKNDTNPGLDIFDICPESECDFLSKSWASSCPYFVNHVGCVACPRGYYPQTFPTAEYGLLAYCKSAPAGSYILEYQDPLSKPIPKSCPSGTYQYLSHQTSCFNCSAGTYNPSTGSSSPAACIACPPGSANPNVGSQSLTACQECPLGTASPSAGVAECLPCAAGTYQNQTGQLQCVACGENLYREQRGAQSPNDCLPCPSNAPFSAPGSTSHLSCSVALPCANGNYSNADNPSLCDPCDTGSYCQKGKTNFCLVGSFSNVTGSSSCYSCGVGFIGSEEGSWDSSDCYPCPLSTFSDNEVSSICFPCPPGTFSTILGSSSAMCLEVDACNATSNDPPNYPRVGPSPTLSSTSTYCQTGSVAPIQLSRLLPAGIALLQAFRTQLDQAARIEIDPLSRRYTSTNRAPSLRLADFPSDATGTLSLHDATLPSTDTNSIHSGAGNSAMTTDATIMVLTLLLSIAFLSWPIYRRIPPPWAFHCDQFKMNHAIDAGQSPVNQPTQFGSAVTWSFLWIALLVAILLGTASNTVTTTSLVPPSTLSYAGTARADFQITIRAYGSNGTVADYCRNDTQFPAPDGFVNFTYRFQPHSDVCSIAADCFNCTLDSGSSSVPFIFPYDTQFFEWELFVNSAAPNTWSRRYGVLTQLPHQLFDLQSELQFTAIESYFTDRTQSGSGVPRSGFEVEFKKYNSIQLPPEGYKAPDLDSGVTIKFTFNMSDFVFDSYTSNKLSALQLVLSILTAIVSLFSIFGIIFNIVESKILNQLLHRSSGELRKDDQGRIRLGHETSTNDVIKDSLSHTVNPRNSESVESGPNEIELEVNVKSAAVTPLDEISTSTL